MRSIPASTRSLLVREDPHGIAQYGRNRLVIEPEKIVDFPNFLIDSPRPILIPQPVVLIPQVPLAPSILIQCTRLIYHLKAKNPIGRMVYLFVILLTFVYQKSYISLESSFLWENQIAVETTQNVTCDQLLHQLIEKHDHTFPFLHLGHPPSPLR